VFAVEKIKRTKGSVKRGRRGFWRVFALAALCLILIGLGFLAAMAVSGAL
jgi:hypothetical protein